MHKVLKFEGPKRFFWLCYGTVISLPFEFWKNLKRFFCHFRFLPVVVSSKNDPNKTKYCFQFRNTNYVLISKLQNKLKHLYKSCFQPFLRELIIQIRHGGIRKKKFPLIEIVTKSRPRDTFGIYWCLQNYRPRTVESLDQDFLRDHVNRVSVPILTSFFLFVYTFLTVKSYFQKNIRFNPTWRCLLRPPCLIQI